MRIKLEVESDELIDGLYIYVDENQQVKVYQTWLDIDEGKELEATVEIEFRCPSCENWVKPADWTGKYICQMCAWDALETEAYGESLE